MFPTSFSSRRLSELGAGIVEQSVPESKSTTVAEQASYLYKERRLPHFLHLVIRPGNCMSWVTHSHADTTVQNYPDPNLHDT